MGHGVLPGLPAEGRRKSSQAVPDPGNTEEPRMRRHILPEIGLFVSLLAAAWLALPSATAHPLAQETPIPTLTGTPVGALVKIVGGGELQIHVRSGPGTTFPLVGILVVGQEVPALGRSPGGDWIKVVYPGAPDGTGWVFSPYTRLIQGELPILEIPPTPVPDTPTPDPTLAAQFQLAPPPTRLPTFTPAPTLASITFPQESVPLEERFPVGLVVATLMSVGLLGLLASYLRAR